MPDDSASTQPVEPQPTTTTSMSGGANAAAGRDVTIVGDVAGRDIIKVTGYTVEQVNTLIAQISKTFQPKPFDGKCPYLGLDFFTEDDADRFFGRETLVKELVARVKDSRSVIIAGPSGSGKSSLVRAGVLHALKQGALPNSDRWLYATFNPGREPIAALVLALGRMAKDAKAGDYLRERATDVTALHKSVETLLSDRPDQRAVIFVDQFEEIFTQVSSEAQRVACLNLLAYAATLDGGRVMVLFAMRSDFVANCATYPQLNALINQKFVQVGTMQPEELVNAIACPALQVGLQIDPDLVAQIINDMQGEPGVLPLMQFALKDLFDDQQAKSTELAKSLGQTKGGVMALTRAGYLARGGLRKALERHADAAFAKLSANEKQLARSIFAGLIEIGRGHEDTRRTATFDELARGDMDITQVKAVVQKLADARLVTTENQGDKNTATISHERLIDAWSWLHELVRDNRETIALQNQIAEDAQHWADNNQDASYLYTGTRLALARTRLQASGAQVSELGQAFVQASLRAQRRDQIRRIGNPLLVLLSVALLIGGGLLANSLILQARARGETVLVSAGEFVPGTAEHTTVPIERRATWTAHVAEFRIEKYEVTNAQYRLCVQAGVCSEPDELALYASPEKDSLPVVKITLKQATDYCQWLGRRVPSEIEWEWAARGPEDWPYPTGNEEPIARDINVNNYQTARPEYRVAVDHLPAEHVGTYGMAGNVAEWTTSAALPYDHPLYATTLWNKPPFDDATREQLFIARGGSWQGGISQARSTSRYPLNPAVAAESIGVRCIEGSAPPGFTQEVP